MSPDDPRHGTNSGYLAHRRTDRDACQPCRTAHVRYEKRRMHDSHLGQPRMIDVTGTRRRIEALVALGWTYRAIGEQVGVTVSGVHKAINRYTLIRRDVAKKYAAAYDAMCMTLPPMETRQQKRDANYARTVARKHGYLPPLAWDDIDTDPAPHVGRETARPTSVLLAEWDHLRGLGVSDHHAAAQLGVTPKAIEKAIERARRTAA